MKTVNGSFAGTSSLVKSVLAKPGKQFKDTLRNWDDTNPVDIENFAENTGYYLCQTSIKFFFTSTNTDGDNFFKEILSLWHHVVCVCVACREFEYETFI
mgnify:CR=1 FL=1